MNYYINESGNTGDLANSDTEAGFAGQPIFLLAAIGIANRIALTAITDRIKSSHRIALSELKSSRLLSRPAFVLDVVRLICDEHLPYFVESWPARSFVPVG